MTGPTREELVAIAEAANQWPWEVHQDPATSAFEVRTSPDGDVVGDTGQHIVVGDDLIAVMADAFGEEANARFIATFNPAFVLSLLRTDEARERKLEVAVMALEELLGIAELYVPASLDAPGFKRARAALSSIQNDDGGGR